MPPGGKHLSPDQIEIIGKWDRRGAPTLREEPEQLNFGRRYHARRTSVLELPADSESAGARDLATDGARPRLMPSCYRGEGERPGVHQKRTSHVDQTRFARPARAAADSGRGCGVCCRHRSGCYERLVERLLILAPLRRALGRGTGWMPQDMPDSDGYSAEDCLRPQAYKYRDYVIRSLNANKALRPPADRQFAGDELLTPHEGDYARRDWLLTATGFLRMAADGTTPSVDQMSPATRSFQTRSRLSRRRCWACRWGAVSVTTIAMTDSASRLLPPASGLRAGLYWKTWRNPSSRGSR